MKKLFSVILCLSLLVALCIPAMAADSRTNVEASSRITLSNNTTLVSEDLPNGDARFTILGEDGCVLSESYLQRSEGLIHYESKLTDSFETRRIPTQTNDMHLQRSVSRGAANSYIPSDFTYRGSITYNFYGWTDHVIGTRILNVYYDYNYHIGSRSPYLRASRRLLQKLLWGVSLLQLAQFLLRFQIITFAPMKLKLRGWLK